MFTDKFSAILLGPVEMKMEEKSTELEYWEKVSQWGEGRSLQKRWKIPAAWG